MHPVLSAIDERSGALDRPPLQGLQGRFHSHLTLRVPPLGPADRARLEGLAVAHRSKLTVIELRDFAERVERDVM
ncbi:MAG: hypothetical protein AAF211_24170 [Myxococcota bacterium]